MKKYIVAIIILAMSMSTAVATSEWPVQCDIRSKISEIEPELRSIPLAVGTKDFMYSEVRINKKQVFHDPEKQITLGMINRETCNTRIVTIIKRGDRLIAPSGYQIEVVERVNGIRWNSYATQYEVTEPKGWFVVINNYPLVQKTGSGRSGKRVVTNILYSPFVPEFARPEFVAAGLEYPHGVLTRVNQYLRDSNVMSRTDPETSIVEIPALKVEYIERLFPIEHMDQMEFTLDSRWTADRIYALIGINGDRTASRTCSPASACGPWQFTKGTWQVIQRTYPAAHLPVDFMTGAQDPFWAATAAYLLNDYNLAIIKQGLSEAQFAALLTDSRLTEELLATAYNTGVGRTVGVYKAFLAKGTGDWFQAQGKAKIARFVNETKGYILKLRYIRDEWPSEVIARANKTPGH